MDIGYFGGHFGFWAIKKIGMMGFLGTFDIMFLISLANYPEKFSLVLFFSRSKPIYPGLIPIHA